jgi:YceI-like domain
VAKKKNIKKSGMKKINVAFTLFLLFFFSQINAQDKFYTKSGKISFFSTTTMENINATNKSAVCLLNTKTGDLQFAVLLKGFEFKKALMQEDFNRDYVESDKYPKSEFTGQIVNNSAIQYGTKGTFTVTVKGKLSIHGVTKDVEATGTMDIKDDKIKLNSTFNILIADYQIKVPRIYLDNISKSLKITVDCNLEPLKK